VKYTRKCVPGFGAAFTGAGFGAAFTGAGFAVTGFGAGFAFGAAFTGGLAAQYQRLEFVFDISSGTKSSPIGLAFAGAFAFAATLRTSSAYVGTSWRLNVSDIIG
jgi:hypothetical protein